MRLSFTCALLLVGCATTTETVAPPAAAPSHQKLQQLSSQHTQLLKQLADTPAAEVESCRATAGDCLFQVGDSRKSLMSRLRLDACSDDDFAAKSRCVTAQLEGTERARELADYLSLENWCFSQLTACTTERADAASRATLQAMVAARKQELEGAPAARAARGGVAATRARIEYLRATLPPDVGACKNESEREACTARVDAARHALDESLSSDEYSKDTATASYVALEQMADGCSRPELECLSGIVSSYGVFKESRKWVDRNLELLGRRQELAARLSAASGDRCVAPLQQEHQAGIVSAYVAYVHEPVLYYRTQLDKAFLALHQAQVSCLSAAKPSSAANKPAVATKR